MNDFVITITSELQAFAAGCGTGIVGLVGLLVAVDRVTPDVADE